MTIDGVIFDMDGVVTDTAKVHYRAWKIMFDDFLNHYAHKRKIPYVPFTQEDYLYYVDGMPRYDGIKSFLSSRNIKIPFGDPTDSANKESVCGLGKRKNDEFLHLIERDGVDLFPSTIALIKNLHEYHIKTAIVSSSKNCKTILKKAGIEELFDTRVDGETLNKLGLLGKPQPDMFLEAAKRLSVEPKNSIVIEDAISGVQAGRAGNFRLVVGIDRKGTLHETFKSNGADLVVLDLEDLSIDEIEKKWI